MSQERQDHALADAICQHLANSVARPQQEAPSAPAAEQPAEGWYVRLAVHGRGHAYVWLALSTQDAIAISKRTLGIQDEELDEGALRDTLRELIAQAVTSATGEPAGLGLNIQIDTLESSLEGVPASPARVRAYDIGEGTTIVLATWTSPRVEESVGAAQNHSPQSHAEQLHADHDHAEYLRSDGGGFGASFSTGPENLDLVLDIDLPMSVRFGRTEMALGALTHLGPGSVIDLGRSPDEPVEMIVSGRVVARGDVVVVGGNFGVRITDVLHAPAGRRD